MAENLASRTAQSLLEQGILQTVDEVLGCVGALAHSDADTLNLLRTMTEKGMVKGYTDVLNLVGKFGSLPSAMPSRPPVVPVAPVVPVTALKVPSTARAEPRAVTMAPPSAAGGASEDEGDEDAGRKRRPPKTPGRLLRDADGRVVTAREMGQAPSVPIRDSFRDDEIICLEDGVAKQMLKRYLNTEFGMTVEEYIAKWELPPDYPMTAPNFSKQKSALASNLGLGKHKREKRVEVEGEVA